MTLPKIDLPTYELTIPSSNKRIRVRPFIVKEEKLLFMATESGDTNEIIDTTLQVINNCILDEGVDVNELPFFDIDYLFIGLRAKSISENVDIKYTCNALVNGDKCGNIFDANIDLTNSLIVGNDVPFEIEIGGGRKVIMRYPTYKEIKRLAEKKENIDKKIDLIATCIDIIQDKEKVFSKKDYTHKEMISFVESMTESSFKKLEYFVDNLPTFVVVAAAQCPKCGFEHKLRYTDFERFFI